MYANSRNQYRLSYILLSDLPVRIGTASVRSQLECSTVCQQWWSCGNFQYRPDDDHMNEGLQDGNCFLLEWSTLYQLVFPKPLTRSLLLKQRLLLGCPSLRYFYLFLMILIICLCTLRLDIWLALAQILTGQQSHMCRHCMSSMPNQTPCEKRGPHVTYQGPIVLTWFNFNSGMDESSHAK